MCSATAKILCARELVPTTERAPTERNCGCTAHLSVKGRSHLLGSSRTPTDFRHSTSFMEGLLPPLVVEADEHQPEMIAAFPPNLSLRYRVFKVQTDAMKAIVRNGLTSQPAPQNGTLNSLIQLFDAKLSSLVHECQNQLGQLMSKLVYIIMLDLATLLTNFRYALLECGPLIYQVVLFF